MKRTHLSILVSISVAALAVSLSAQEPESKPSPASPYVVGDRLVAWSEFQEPSPVPAVEAAPKASGRSQALSVNPEPQQPAAVTPLYPLQTDDYRCSSTNSNQPGGR